MKEMLSLILWRCWWTLLMVYGGLIDSHTLGAVLIAIGGLGLIVSMVIGAKRPPN